MSQYRRSSRLRIIHPNVSNAKEPPARLPTSRIVPRTNMNESTFVSAFEKWKRKWHDFLKEKTINEITGRTIYTHQRLRSAMVSISTYLPFLFTYEKVKGMPNTNNMIEGTFTDMKKALRNHPGMIKENRKRMINGFFLAYAKLHNKKGDNR